MIDPIEANNIIFRKEIAAAKDKEKKRAELVKDYREKFANPYVAAGLGTIDKVIFPRETRPLIYSGLDMLASKRQNRPPKVGTSHFDSNSNLKCPNCVCGSNGHQTHKTSTSDFMKGFTLGNHTETQKKRQEEKRKSRHIRSPAYHSQKPRHRMD